MSRNRNHRRANVSQIAGRPQDHKQSKNTVRRVNVRGIDIGIDPKGNALQIIPFLRRLLGDSYDKVKNGLRGADGRIDGETMGTFLTELFEEMGKAFPNS